MNKHFIGRASLIGDTIMALPLLNYVNILDPGSYKIFPISKKTSQSAPLFINHPLIDKLYILNEWESLNEEDIRLIKSCVIKVNPFPQHPPCPGLTVGVDNFWYNEYTCVEETIRMAGIDLQSFKEIVPIEQQKPKLELWFKYNKYSKTIGIWGYAGYGQEHRRNPSKEWWNKVTKELIKDFNIFQFGAENEPIFDSIADQLGDKYKRFNERDFFEQVRISVGCNVNINTDSGSGWIIGAYGLPQISLLTNHAPNHTKNLIAFAPENYYNNDVKLFAYGGCDNINVDTVFQAIKKHV